LQTPTSTMVLEESAHLLRRQTHRPEAPQCRYEYQVHAVTAVYPDSCATQERQSPALRVDPQPATWDPSRQNPQRHWPLERCTPMLPSDQALPAMKECHEWYR